MKGAKFASTKNYANNDGNNICFCFFLINGIIRLARAKKAGNLAFFIFIFLFCPYLSSYTGQTQKATDPFFN